MLVGEAVVAVTGVLLGTNGVVAAGMVWVMVGDSVGGTVSVSVGGVVLVAVGVWLDVSVGCGVTVTDAVSVGLGVAVVVGDGVSVGSGVAVRVSVGSGVGDNTVGVAVSVTSCPRLTALGGMKISRANKKNNSHKSEVREKCFEYTMTPPVVY